jgi:hypothetical protein
VFVPESNGTLGTTFRSRMACFHLGVTLAGHVPLKLKWPLAPRSMRGHQAHRTCTYTKQAALQPLQRLEEACTGRDQALASAARSIAASAAVQRESSACAGACILSCVR